MGAKEAFIEALNQLPFGLDEYKDTAIPTLEVFGSPDTVEDALIANGKLSYNLNCILLAFVGLTPIELLLRIGQHNSVLQAALLAALEYRPNTLIISSPTPDASYPGFFADWQVESLRGGIDVVSGEVRGEIFEFDETTPGIFTADFPVPIGMHTATIAAGFQDGTTLQKTVSFAVTEFSTYPANGETVSELIDFQVFVAEDAPQPKVEIKTPDGGTLSGNMQFDTSLHVWKFSMAAHQNTNGNYSAQIRFGDFAGFTLRSFAIQ